MTHISGAAVPSGEGAGCVGVGRVELGCVLVSGRGGGGRGVGGGTGRVVFWCVRPGRNSAVV